MPPCPYGPSASTWHQHSEQFNLGLQGHEKRLSRFDFATWPYLLLLVQHPGLSLLDAQKPNLSHVASRRSFRARFALEDLSRVPFPLPMIVAREG